MSNSIDHILKINDKFIKNKLINWRRGKVYYNYFLIQNDYHFNPSTFNTYIFPHIIHNIHPYYLNLFKILSFTQNYTIVDCLIHLKEYKLAYHVIQLCSQYLYTKSTF